MTQYWIFVLLPYSDFNRGNVTQTLNKVKRTGIWLIGKKTINRYKLSKGDKVLFYLAGEEGKKFLGSAELTSNLISDKLTLNDYVKVKDIDFWTNFIPIKGMVDDLSFIKNKAHWGLHFQGGIISIPELDYKLIVTNSKCMEKEKSL
jgi:predicted RNA-binding protein